MYSTAREDELIEEHFKKIGVETGRFLDIASANGITLSNTHLFALKGWKGVCVEANAQELFNLLNLYWDNPNIEIIQGCISDSYGLKEFWNAKSANTSTSSKRMQDRGREREGARHVRIAGFSLEDIWKQYGHDFGLISLDLEDGTLPIMHALPMDKLSSVKAVVVEYLRADWYFGEDEKAEVIAWGEKNGFKVVTITNENVVLVRE